MGVLDRVREAFEERTGYGALRGQLSETTEEMYALRNEAEELGYRTLDYFSGRPQEMRRETRQRLAQRSRVAFMEDPIAGAEAEHYANFSLGRGIGRPRAKDENVQKIIDEAFDDPANQEVLTGYEALRSISHELKTGANLFALAFPKNGRVRVSFLNADSVHEIVPDDNHRLRPLWYMAKEIDAKWDFENDRMVTPDLGSVIRYKYYAHHSNVELAERERKENKEEPLKKPPKDKVGEGVVYHVRVNRLMEQRFGTPPWNRTLRFMSAMARLTEARVNMALAASSFIAKRVIKGGPQEVIRSAQSLLQQTGEIGAAMPKTREALTGQMPAPRPGSFWVENDGEQLQSLALNSGSGAAVADSQIVRAAATAPSAFGQHYFGDASNANLATAVSLELPALMAIGSWQETLEQLIRWFTDMVIQEAVRAGKLGGSAKKEETDKSLRELILSEAEDKEQAERRTGKEFDYTFQMPYPGRRNLPEVTSAFTSVMAQLSPIGENPELTKIMLEFLFTHGLQLEDAAGAAEEVAKVQAKLLKSQAEQQAKAAEEQQKAFMAAQQGGGEEEGGPPGSTPTDDKQSQYGEKRQNAQPSGDMGTLESWLPEGTEADTEVLLGNIRALFNAGLVDPGVKAATALNGDGSDSADSA